MTKTEAQPVHAPHDCGLCDGPLMFDGYSGVYATFICPACDGWHIAKDCCHQDDE